MYEIQYISYIIRVYVLVSVHMFVFVVCISVWRCLQKYVEVSAEVSVKVVYIGCRT